jgi:hypothetical protein
MALQNFLHPDLILFKTVSLLTGRAEAEYSACKIAGTKWRHLGTMGVGAEAFRQCKRSMDETRLNGPSLGSEIFSGTYWPGGACGVAAGREFVDIWWNTAFHLAAWRRNAEAYSGREVAPAVIA